MSKIEELLKDEKVEWKKLEKVFEIRNGYTPSKQNQEFWHNGDIPWFRMDDLRESGRLLRDSKQHITEKAIKGKGLFKSGSIILATTATIGEHAMLLVDSLANQRFTNFEIRKPLKNRLLPKYVFYYFDIIDKWCKDNIKVSSFPAVNMDKLVEVMFPIPSLETQKKIVEILDNFTDCVTELQAELQAELQNRTKQYEYYRNMLLSEEYLHKFSDKLGILPMEGENRLRCTTLGEIGKICMCKRILKEQTLPNGDVPFYKIGTFGKKADAFISRKVFDEYKEKYSYPKEGEVLISCSGTIGRTVIFDGKDAYFQDSNIIWLSHNESRVLNKYLFYFYQNVKWNATSGGTISRLYTYNLLNLKIELPSLLLQNKIVEILDKFQSMLSDTKGLLPKEIEQRQKQYEYYREKLLTFDMESDSKQASKQAK